MKKNNGKPARFEARPEGLQYRKEIDCPVELVIAEIGGKWKASILFNLRKGALRFSDLRKRMNRVTPRMLIRQLRELESSGLIYRDVYPEVPPRVEYGLTRYGESLTPVMNAMARWGKERTSSQLAKPL